MLRRRVASVTACLLVVAALGAGLAVGLRALRPSNPLREQAVDRSQPALLRSLTDLAELHAAEGSYQVLVDVERETPYVPAVVKGQRTVYAAQGSVDALVDLSAIGPGDVRVEGQVVHVALPAVRLDEAALDLAQSRVVSRQRGVLDRIGSAVGQEDDPHHDLLVLAEGKVAAAAQADAQLRQRAEANARATLTALVRGLGYGEVVVTFRPAPAA